MRTTIVYGSTTVTPQVVDGWSEQHEASTVMHRLIGGGVEFTYGSPFPRTFTLRLVFRLEDDARACAALHRTAPYLDLTNDERAIANGRYTVADSGRVNVDLDDLTRDAWVVTVDATEVPV